MGVYKFLLYLQNKGKEVIDTMGDIISLLHSDKFVERDFNPTLELVNGGETVGYIFSDKNDNKIALSSGVVQKSGLYEEYYMDCLSLDKWEVDISADFTKFWDKGEEIKGLDTDNIIGLLRDYELSKDMSVYKKHSGMLFDCSETLVNIFSI